MGSEIQSQKVLRDPRSTVELYSGIRPDHGSNTAFSREIFWDHRSDFGINGHVWTTYRPIFYRPISSQKVKSNVFTGLALPKWKIDTRVICQGRGAKKKTTGKRGLNIISVLTLVYRLIFSKKGLRSAAFAIARVVTQKTIWPRIIGQGHEEKKNEKKNGKTKLG